MMPGECDKPAGQAGFFGGFSKNIFLQKPASGLVVKDDSDTRSSSTAAGGAGSGMTRGSNNFLNKIASLGVSGTTDSPSTGMRRRATVADFGTAFEDIAKKASESNGSASGMAPPAAPNMKRRESMPVSVLTTPAADAAPTSRAAQGGRRGSAGNMWSWLTTPNAGMEQNQSLIGSKNTILETSSEHESSPSGGAGRGGAGGLGTGRIGNRSLNAFTPSGW